MQKKQLNSRDLVYSAINHQITPRVPRGELVLKDIKSTESQNGKSAFERDYSLIHEMGLDIVSLSPIYDSGNDFYIDYISLEIEKWTQNTSLFTFVILDGAFEYGLRYFGFDSYMKMIMKDPQGVNKFISKVEVLNIQTAAALADKGVNGIILADDIAFQSGLLIHPKYYRDIFLPSMIRQVKYINDLDMIPFFHSDGNYLQVIDDITDAGFRGLHCIDKNCGVTLEKLKPYKDKLCLWGHLDMYDLELSNDSAGLSQIVSTINSVTDFKGIILGTNSGLFHGMDINALKKIYTQVDKAME